MESKVIHVHDGYDWEKTKTLKSLIKFWFKLSKASSYTFLSTVPRNPLCVKLQFYMFFEDEI